MITIAVANQKGGVGKTTVAFNLAQILSSRRRTKVLAIDNDPQGNLTSSFLENPLELNAHVLDAYDERPFMPMQISENLYLLGSDITLAQVERHPVQLLARHVQGDWGDLCEHDRELNEQALDPDHPTRLFSRYEIDDEIFYVISEWDRSITTVLRSDEY